MPTGGDDLPAEPNLPLFYEEEPIRFQGYALDYNHPDKFNALLDNLVFPKEHGSPEAYIPRKLLEYAYTVLKARYMIVEREYEDVDYHSMYSYWYSNSFKKFGRLCSRIHLFTSKIDVANVCKSGENELQKRYLGYTVITPLLQGKIGRTVVRPIVNEFHDCKGLVHRPHMISAPIRVRLNGALLRVYGTPFISGDGMVMVCAESAIWMTLQLFYKKYARLGFRRHLPSEICDATHQSFQYQGRIVPSEGLTVTNMLETIGKLGYAPTLDMKPEDENSNGCEDTESAEKVPTQVSPDDSSKQQVRAPWWRAVNWIFKYIDSEIPVILTLDKPEHAVAVTGCLCADSMPAYHKYAGDSSHNSYHFETFDRWVSAFIVNDSSLGPYRLMPFVYPVQKEGETQDHFHKRREAFNPFSSDPLHSLQPNGDTWRSFEVADGMIVPLPKLAALQARHIDAIVETLLFPKTDGKVDSTLSPIVKHWMDSCAQKGIGKSISSAMQTILECVFEQQGEAEPVKTPPETTLVTRSYLIRAKEFIRRIDVYPKRLRNFYSAMRFPRYLWVVELTTRAHIDGIEPKQRRIFGELLLDSTADKFAPSLLAANLCGAVVVRDPDSEVPRTERIGGISTYWSSRVSALSDLSRREKKLYQL